ncbi:MAG: hypothetical protein U0704_01685 [Candidatus Eisenbacteria bacterium]
MIAPRAARSPFHLQLAIGFLVVALVGFSTTFFVPLSRGSFTALPFVYFHAACLFGWLALLIAQAALVQVRNVSLHRRLGWLGVALVAGIVVSGVVVGAFASRRDLASGATWPYGAYVNIVIEMLTFGTLAGSALALRRRPEFHKRLLVLATISALGPAWFRFRHFMPFVPNPIVSFSLVADSVWLAVMLREWRVLGRVHPVYLWAGGAMFAVHLTELAAADSRLWLDLGRALLGLAGS